MSTLRQQYIAWTGTDSRLNVADITGGEHNKVTLNETSKFGPAITFFRGKLFLA